MRGLGLVDTALVARTNPVSVNLPTDLANLVRWYKADSFALSDGDAIGAAGRFWTDNSASAVDMTNTSGANRPLYKTNIFGSMPAIRFAVASNTFLNQATALTLAGNFTLIAVMANTGDGMLFGNTASNYQIRVSRSGSNVLAFYIGGTECISSAFSTTSTSVRANSWRRNNGTLSFRENTTSRGATGDGAGNLSFDIDEAGRTSFGGYLTGDVGEILVYSATLSDADHDSLYNNYLKPRWGLP